MPTSAELRSLVQTCNKLTHRTFSENWCEVIGWVTCRRVHAVLWKTTDLISFLFISTVQYAWEHKTNLTLTEQFCFRLVYGLCLSVSQSVCLSVCLCPTVSLLICPSVCLVPLFLLFVLSLCVFSCLSVSVSVCFWCVCLSVVTSSVLPVWLPTCLSVCPSIPILLTQRYFSQSIYEHCCCQIKHYIQKHDWPIHMLNWAAVETIHTLTIQKYTGRKIS